MQEVARRFIHEDLEIKSFTERVMVSTSRMEFKMALTAVSRAAPNFLEQVMVSTCRVKSFLVANFQYQPFKGVISTTRYRAT